MDYLAKVQKEGKYWLVEFPDCPGCQTFGDTKEEARAAAAEALAGWLETQLQGKESPPRPEFKGPGFRVGVPAALGLKLQLRWARADAKLTQSELARRLGVSQQMVAKLEHPNYEPSLSKVELAARAMGLGLSVQLVTPDSSGGSDSARVTEYAFGARQKGEGYVSMVVIAPKAAEQHQTFGSVSPKPRRRAPIARG